MSLLLLLQSSGGGSPSTNANAGVASATGAAAAAPSVAQSAGVASATGTASGAAVYPIQPVAAGVASATGAAWGAVIYPQQPVNAGVAQGTGTANGATITAVNGGIPLWTTPADTVSMSATPVLAFTMPSLGSPMHFNLQLDTVNTFNGGDLRDLSTFTSQTGWEYWDGAAWQAVPGSGVPAIYGGNAARHTVQTALSSNTWYRRIRAGT